MDIKQILKKHGIEETFPTSAIKEAKRVPLAVLPMDAKRRVDFRQDTVITIDGEDAKDLDDAVSVVKNDDDTYTLTVHIADVSHYVTDGSALDREAAKRGTSAYFPNFVVPMLPRELSNGICSLHPNVDRLTLSVIMKIDADGQVFEHKICEGIICTKHRMTYTQTTEILSDISADPTLKVAHEQKYGRTVDMLVDMQKLTAILEANQRARGAIDFDIAEAKIIVDDKGKVTDIIKADRTVAHKIIEQFMIIANETVAAHMTAQKIPCVYRVHEKPSPEKLLSFSEFAGFLGYKNLGKIENIRPKIFQGLLQEAKGSDTETLLRKSMLRAMAKAIYSEKNMGHFGLASRCYCHFTSPIRRYPDLLVHRVLKASIKGELDQKRKLKLSHIVMAAADSSSLRERAAEEAERDVDDIKKAEFMASHVGEEFDAAITGVTGFGLFCGLDNTIEGLVRLESLPYGPYVYLENRYSLKGRTKTFRLGDKVRVRCTRVVPELGHIDFELI